MIRNPLFRRFVAATVMVLGLFTQFQVVFACELMDGKVQYVCCCDEPGSMGCAMGGGCHDSRDTQTQNCCAVSYEPMPNATAIAPESHSLQVLLLDAPQPPPIPVSSDIPEFSPDNHALRFTHALAPHVAGTDTYLLTNRFRI